MSIRVMSRVWDLDLPAFEKLVLLALADCANDEGLAWPSVATLGRKTGASERTIQRAVQAVEKAGHLWREQVPGRGCRYHINPRHSDTPVTVTPPSESRPTPVTVTPHPRQSDTQSVNEPSGTVTPDKRERDADAGGDLFGDQPAVEIVADEPPEPVALRDRDWLSLPDWLPVVQWNAWLEMRRKRGKWPTARAIELTIGKLTDWRAKGHDPGDVLDRATENSWTGIFEPKDLQNGNRQANGRPAAGPSGPDRRDGTTRAIDRLGGFDRPRGTA